MCQTDCAAGVSVEHLMAEKMGLAHFFKISCTVCPWHIKFSSSKQCDRIEGTTGRTGYEINRRTIVAFRENGLGLSGIESFSRCMNMPQPMSKTTFDEISSSIHNAYVEAAQESMNKAANEARLKYIEEDPTNVDEDGVTDISVSGDGAWQKRGYSSLNGVMTLIAEGKCIDNEVMSKKCRQCDLWEKKKGTEEYEKWKKTHDNFCSMNHQGSSGAMEVTGLKRIYHRSVKNHKLRYKFYIGDGDSKSFAEVSSSNPYPGHNLTKGECIGHVQKRVGTRLRKIKVSYKGRKLSDGKGIGRGKGRLTDKIMNTLQNHYGMAIRQNTDSLYAMKKSVAAVLFHSTADPDPEKRHRFCPRTKDSWCKYQSDKITGEKTYKGKLNIDKTVSDVIADVFSNKDLGNEELLKKCLHGQTQNVNESLNNLIWTRCPKRIYVGNTTFKTAVASAVISFNEGESGLISVFTKLGIEPGHFTATSFQKADLRRVKESNRKATEAEKLRRKRLRAARKGFDDKNAEEEGDVYGYGEH
ncbi:uncharacterized protein [Clytia hemisphaerica]|uniref:uncharacterized protein n=1 Tax=Clytia hemisphaerica TaxID=252671 RepID=UPI0034D4B28F